MGNWNYGSPKLTKCLKSETIHNGGLEQITTPTLECKVSSELEEVTIKVGGFPTYVNYNKYREKEHKKLKEQKRLRSLKKQIKRFAGRKTGDDLPSPVIHLDSCRGHKS